MLHVLHQLVEVELVGRVLRHVLPEERELHGDQGPGRIIVLNLGVAPTGELDASTLQ